ncbi:hypothetical protein B0H14DRAFT_2637873 [Mycena olivaceomarginata]|nr:hypothetical protein B0H14DRAFT_2637873 [Mycena olivaceomarginata]
MHFQLLVLVLLILLIWANLFLCGELLVGPSAGYAYKYSELQNLKSPEMNKVLLVVDTMDAMSSPLFSIYFCYNIGLHHEEQRDRLREHLRLQKIDKVEPSDVRLQSLLALKMSKYGLNLELLGIRIIMRLVNEWVKIQATMDHKHCKNFQWWMPDGLAGGCQTITGGCHVVLNADIVEQRWGVLGGDIIHYNIAAWPLIFDPQSGRLRVLNIQSLIPQSVTMTNTRVSTSRYDDKGLGGARY